MGSGLSMTGGADGAVSSRLLPQIGSTTALNDSESYASDWVDLSGYDSIVVAVATDQNGYLEVRFSPDGVNADSTLTRYYKTALINPPHRFTVTRRYCQVRFFNNSGSNQTYFRLQAMVGQKSDLNIPVDATMAQNYDAISVRPTNFTSEVALGRRQGWDTWNKFGFNLDVDTGGAEVIASFGGTFQYLTSGETLDIVSTSTADDLVGTGVQRIVIYGVDGNWDQTTEVVEMDGTTTVTTTSTWIGINRVAIFKAGSGGTNAGTISITATTSGYNMAEMPAGVGVTQQCIFYVPRNHQFLMSWLRANVNKISGGGSPRVTLKGIVYSDVNTAEQEIYRDTIDTDVDEFVTVHPEEPFIIGEKSILYFTASTDVLNTVVSLRFSGELVRDVDA